MTDLDRKRLASDDSRIEFGDWGVATANELCERTDECQMTWVPTEDLTENGARQSLRFECELAYCAVLAWGLNASPESMAMTLAEKQAAQAVAGE